MLKTGITTSILLSAMLFQPILSRSQSLVISEIMDEPLDIMGNPNDTYGEYIEIFNPNNNPVDLQNWTLSDNGTDSHTISASVVAPAFGFVVLAKSSNSGLNGGVNADYAYGNDITFDNQVADEIVLSNPQGVEIDRVDIGDVMNWYRSGGSAMIFTGVYSDDNNLSSNWTGAPSVQNGLVFNNGSPGSGGDGQIVQYTLVCDSDVWNTTPSSATGNQSALMRNSSQKIFTTEIQVNDLRIETGSAITISASGALTVNGGIKTDGNLMIQNNGILNQTQANNTNQPGNGLYQITRNTGTLVDDTRFQYWSSPIPGATMGGIFSSSNPLDFYYFNESTQQWSQQLSDQIMEPGRGYITTGSVGNSGFSDNRQFNNSIVNNGTFTQNVSLNSGEFALVGNPYPSSISSVAFIADNPTLTGTLYFWNHSTATNYSQTNGNTPADYAHWTALGSTSGNSSEPPNDYIGSCQGFFVQAGNAGTPQIIFNNSQRVTTGNNQFFDNAYPSAKRFWLNLTGTQNKFNQILVGFDNQATEGIDPAIDGVKLKGGPLSLYSFSNQKELAIQGLPLPTATRYTKIPLGIDATESGFYTFVLDSLQNWSADQDLLLYDRKYQATVDLLIDSSYTFQLDQPGQNHQRFEIWTKLKVSNAGNVSDAADPFNTNVEEEVPEPFDWLVFDSMEGLQLMRSDASDLLKVSIFNINGRLLDIFDWKVGNKNRLVNSDAWGIGTYIIEVSKNSQYRSTQTVIIK